MAPHATADEPPQPILTKHELPADKAKYIVTKPELEECLKKVFGSGVEFDVSTKSGRWIYHAKRKLTNVEVSKWIAELDKRKKAKDRARAGAGRLDMSEASGTSGGK